MAVDNLRVRGAPPCGGRGVVQRSVSRIGCSITAFECNCHFVVLTGRKAGKHIWDI